MVSSPHHLAGLAAGGPSTLWSPPPLVEEGRTGLVGAGVGGVSAWLPAHKGSRDLTAATDSLDLRA